jgi:hypothetical protein
MSTKKLSFKAWAICNNKTGRIMLIEVGNSDMIGYCRMEAPAIYMTRRAAMHHARSDEHLIPVTIINAEKP